MTSRIRPALALALLGALLVGACAPEPVRPSVNQPPLAVLDVPDEAAVGEEVFVDGNASTDLDPGGIVSDVFLLFGDGSDPVVDFTAEHTWTEPGQFLVELYIHDDDGAGARARRRIRVHD
jgi:hypothetical protein